MPGIQHVHDPDSATMGETTMVLEPARGSSGENNEAESQELLTHQGQLCPPEPAARSLAAWFLNT